jgi:hypothetical protein
MIFFRSRRVLPQVKITMLDYCGNAPVYDCYMEGFFRRDKRFTFTLCLEYTRTPDTFRTSRISHVQIERGETIVWTWEKLPLQQSEPKSAWLRLLLSDLLEDIELAFDMKELCSTAPYLWLHEAMVRRFLSLPVILRGASCPLRSIDTCTSSS